MFRRYSAEKSQKIPNRWHVVDHASGQIVALLGGKYAAQSLARKLNLEALASRSSTTRQEGP